MEYMEFFANHFADCPHNHEGSAQPIETAGSVTIFGRSLETRNTRYNPHIGDRDSTAFRGVQKAQPYGPDYNLIKEQCIDHVKKQL